MRLARATVQVAFALTLAAMPRCALADLADEIVRIHLAALGGADRIAALQAYRATGHIVIGNQRIALTVVAARPARLRVEMRYPNRTVVQATDGTHPPWQTDSTTDPQVELMRGSIADDFNAAAEFDDPLVGAQAYGCSIDYAGEMKVDGRPMLRLLATERLTKVYSLLLDPETYLIVARIDERVTARGEMARMVTRYADYRPVGGVLSPHVISVYSNGLPVREAVLDHIEPNPAVRPEWFAPPGS